LWQRFLSARSNVFLSEFGLPCRWLVPFGEDNLALAVSRLIPSASSRLGSFDGFVYSFFSTKGVVYASATRFVDFTAMFGGIGWL
jgi:hypothetical protein